MIHTYAPGRSQIHEANNAAAASVGLQGAALIRELRRVQMYLESERFRECERFPHAVDVRPAHSGSDHERSVGSRAPPKSANRAFDSLLNVLGLRRRKPICAEGSARLHGKTPQATRPLRQEANVLFHPWPKQNPERRPCPSSSTKMESGHSRHVGAQHSAGKAPQVSLLDRIGIRSPAKVRNGLRSGFVAKLETMRSIRAFERLRAAFAFLVSRARVCGLEDGSEPDLSARLAHTFEGELKIGLRVLILGIGILGGWSVLVPLSSAVIVPGTVVVESNLKKIQHPTGGVVANIPVRDGMHVSAGDLLLRLDDTQLRANARVLTQQLDQLRVRLARLIAERDGMDAPQMPHEMASRSSDDDVSRLWASEILLFKIRAAARRNAKELLRSRVGQLKEQISGLDAQVKSKADQHDLISSELEGVEGLYQKGLVPLTRKASLQREAARLDGDRGQAAAAIAEANSKISEAELQAVRIDQDFRTEVMKDLREAQDKEAELIEKSVAAQDLLRRVDLRAPISGIVHQLLVHTIGGVVTPGEVAMELVPESDELQIEAKLPPQDIDHVHSGQATYIRFSAFNQRTTPQFEGVVSYVSADLSHDRQVNANAAYYTVRVTLPPSERRRLGSLQLVSGMPVEVFLQTGSRTMMSYLLKPITEQLRRTFN